MRKWNDLNKKLPNKSGKYLIYLDGVIICAEYSKKHNLFNYSDLFGDEYAKQLGLHPTHWMNLPNPPKKGR